MDFSQNQNSPNVNIPQSQGDRSQEPTQPAKSKFGLILIILVLIFIVATGVLAFTFKDKIPFFTAGAPYEESGIIKGIAEGVAKIDTASYIIAVGIHSEPRDADAEPFKSVISEEEMEAMSERYKRDRAKFTELSLTLSRLSQHHRTNNRYPTNLDEIRTNTSGTGDDLVYRLAEAGNNFNLTIDFETDEAIKVIRNRATSTVRIMDRTVVFTKESPRFYFFSDQPIEPMIVSLLNMSRQFAYIPSDIKVDVSFLGETQKTDTEFNARFQASGDLDFEDLVMAFDADMRKIGDAFYFQINKFPSLFFFDISGIRGKWIKFVPSDDSNRGMTGFVPFPTLSSFEELDKKKEQLGEQLEIFLNVADKHDVLTAGRSIKGDVGGVAAYRYDLTFNKEKLIPFVQEVSKEFDKISTGGLRSKSPIEIDPSTIAYMQSPEFNEVFDYLQENTRLSIWAQKNGIPIKLEYSFRLVPSARAMHFEGKQIKLSAELTLKDVNRTVTIDEPEDSITYDEAVILLSGLTEEEYESQQIRQKESRIKSYMSSLRAHAEIFYGQNNQTYSGFCSDSSISSIVSQIEELIDGSLDCTVPSGGKSYSISIPFENGKYFCVDSTGFAREVSNSRKDFGSCE